MNTLDVLVAAREVLSDRSRFFQPKHIVAYSSVDNAGNEAVSYSEDACQWCAVGALHKVTRNQSLLFAPAQVLLEEYITETYSSVKNMHGFPIIWLNDTMGYDAVIAAYDAVIAKLRQEIQ